MIVATPWIQVHLSATGGVLAKHFECDSQDLCVMVSGNDSGFASDHGAITGEWLNPLLFCTLQPADKKWGRAYEPPSTRLNIREHFRQAVRASLIPLDAGDGEAPCVGLHTRLSTIRWHTDACGIGHPFISLLKTSPISYFTGRREAIGHPAAIPGAAQTQNNSAGLHLWAQQFF